MSLVGNLEDLGLGEILQIVSLSRRSGVLSLSSRGREGRISFRQGQVIRATSPTYQEGLGEVLVRKGLIDQEILRRALSIQKGEGFKERLGTILIKYFQVPTAAIEDVVREQIENVVYSLFDWTDGTFDFELQENLEAVDDVGMDPMQFMLDQGLNPQYLAMEGTRLIDERRHQGEETDSEQPMAQTPPVEEGLDLNFNLIESPNFLSSPRLSAATDGKPLLVMVDDNADTLGALAPYLENGGYAVCPFARGEDAITELAALYRSGQRPTALIDVLMPRMDGAGVLGGVELLDLIKDNFPDIPVLAMTDYHNSEAEWKVRRLRFPLIMKPRKNELGDSGVLRSFAEKLLAELIRARTGSSESGWVDRVNLGDELRLEMGEESAYDHVSPVVQSTGISLLRGMLEELHNPSLGGGIILLVLRFASEFMNRAVIFNVKEDEIVGLGQFGIGDQGGLADSAIRNMKIPRGENSLLGQAIESQLSVKIKPGDNTWDNYVIEKLGGTVPTEVFIGPLVSEGKVVALLYGDNLPEKKPIGDTDSLEIFLSQAGLAMEKAILQRRLKEKGLEGM